MPDITTNPSQSDLEREYRQANASIVDATNSLSENASIVTTSRQSMPKFGSRDVPGVMPGAERPSPPEAEIIVNDINGKLSEEDLRVRIMVPPKYLTSMTNGSKKQIYNIRGVIFPYTPTINCEFKADYSSESVMHSNFAINFYQRSSVSAITISGKFTVQNEDDAAVYLSTTHLLKSLTKMRSGGRPSAGTGRGSVSSLGYQFDPDSGAPPPICRLFAHGEMMFNNIPVAITSFKVDLPNDVDYFTLTNYSEYGSTSVPVSSTIAITCLPMYSRNEMQKFSVSKYLSDNSLRKAGYL